MELCFGYGGCDVVGSFKQEVQDGLVFPAAATQRKNV